MSELRRGDLIWTLEQCYGIVEALYGPEAVVFLGTGKRVRLPVASLFRVTPHAVLAEEAEQAANFAKIMRGSAPGRS